MRCSRLIIIFGILFCLSFTTVSYERFVLKSILRQKEKTERITEQAADVAMRNLSKGIYEPEAQETAKEVFDLAYRALYEKDEGGLKTLTIALNGKEVTGSGLQSAKKGDTLTAVFELLPERIEVPGRQFSYEMVLERSVTLD